MSGVGQSIAPFIAFVAQFAWQGLTSAWIDDRDVKVLYLAI